MEPPHVAEGCHALKITVDYAQRILDLLLLLLSIYIAYLYAASCSELEARRREEGGDKKGTGGHVCHRGVASLSSCCRRSAGLVSDSCSRLSAWCGRHSAWCGRYSEWCGCRLLWCRRQLGGWMAERAHIARRHLHALAARTADDARRYSGTLAEELREAVRRCRMRIGTSSTACMC